MKQIHPLSGTEMSLVVAHASDQGCVRSRNEDAVGFFRRDDAGSECLMVVADGMGGGPAGETASRIVLEVLPGAYFRAGAGEPSDRLREAVAAANTAILERSSSDIDLSGMGTTCTAAAIVGRQLFCAHVGDSRAYLLTDRGLAALTTDHLAGGGRRSGDASVYGSSKGHVLSRALGMEARVEVDTLGPLELDDGNAVVLCSDGLTGVVGDLEIRAAVSGSGPDAACAELVGRARGRGGPDNITVLVAKVLRDTGQHGEGSHA